MYSYEKRNLTTSHVHAMLSNAILKMIDKCECFFLLKTNNSIKIDEILEKTFSPWLYTEIEFFNKIRKVNRRVKLTESIDEFAKASGESIRIAHTVDTYELPEINERDLSNWGSEYKRLQNKHFLDILYKIK